jgi:hypothetical protein
MLGFAAASRDPTSRGSLLIVARLLVALGQAAALYLLNAAATAPQSWPATVPALFVPLLLISVYIPLFGLLGLGQIRARPLVIWMAIAAILVAGLGYHDATRGRVPDGGVMPLVWPWFRLWLALSASLFIAHVLVVDATIERRLLPSYPRHFDTAWKLATQLVLALVFVGVFWGVLWLGAGLFKLIGLEFFGRTISKRWFVYPATTLAIALSIHVTDVQPALIRGVRSVALTLFSWLLPLLVAIVVAFLGSLVVISVDALWKTRFATSLLLTAAGLLVFLINCSYQDGAAIDTIPAIKRFAGKLGSAALLPLVGLAIWALALRVEQHGWTVERILAAAVIVVAACYAIGYATAVVGTRWLKRIEIANFVTAYVFLGLVLLLFSPIADPGRLMVADQVARLKAGAVRPDEFDFTALKFDGARWGSAMLAELSQTQDLPLASSINAKAKQALAQTSRWQVNRAFVGNELAERTLVYPSGRTLPPSFSATSPGPMTGINLNCVQTQAKRCIARFVTLQQGGPEAILFLDQFVGYVFEQDSTGKWHKTAQLAGALNCDSLRQGVESGAFRLEAHPWPDLVVGEQRLGLAPTPSYVCPPVGRAP